MKMIFFVALVFLPLVASAQSSMSYGFEAGWNLANLNVSPSTQFPLSNRSTFMAAGFFEYQLNQSWSIQPELIYVQNGAKSNQVGDTTIFKYDYIEIPLLLRARSDYKIQTFDIYPSLFAGPSFGMNVNAQQEDDQTGFVTKRDLKSVTNGTNVTMDVGIGLEVPFNPGGSFVGDARYSFGLTNITTQNIQGENTTIKTKGIQFMGGLKIGI